MRGAQGRTLDPSHMGWHKPRHQLGPAVVPFSTQRVLRMRPVQGQVFHPTCLLSHPRHKSSLGVRACQSTKLGCMTIIKELFPHIKQFFFPSIKITLIKFFFYFRSTTPFRFICIRKVTCLKYCTVIGYKPVRPLQLLSNECSILLRNGVREPLTHACTDLKSSNEICVLSQVITT